MANGKHKNGKNKGRRGFLKTVAMGAGALALPGGAPGQTPPASGPPAASASSAIDYPRTFTGAKCKMIVFPLGGVGSGTLGLGGRGQLCEWWIFNRPDKGNSPHYCFPSIWVQSRNRKPVAKVLEARYMPPYEGPSGLGSDNVPGLPRLESSTFHGKFPMAEVEFSDPDIPVRVCLEAFTPFIPLDADESGLPVAVLRYRVANPANAKANVAIAFSIENPVGDKGRENVFRQGDGIQGLLMRNPFLSSTDPLSGSFALSVLGDKGGQVTYWRGWPTVGWWQGPLLFWDAFSSSGALTTEPAVKGPIGALCLQREIPPGASSDFTFALSWHFPNRTPKRCGWDAVKGHENDLIGNFYCTRFKDAWEAAQYLGAHLPDLERRTRLFVTSMQNSTLPGPVKDAASATLAAYIAPTSFRTSDGEFHAFEGSNEHEGCCFGSCTHVWNYEHATAHLFPSLSRSLRGREFGYLTDDSGRMDFRELLPNNLDRWGLAAADGQMGTLIKLYLDWHLSGDTDWLKDHWPTAKRALEFAWIPGGWDANRDGVMEGVQHNTYDVEFMGPNPLCGVWYLGALRAGEEMARAAGDADAAQEYARLFRSGSVWIDANLFNGEYYIQKITPVAPDRIAKGLTVGMGATDSEHPTYQLGDGCLVDQLVGQYSAHVAGLGPLLDEDHMRAALQAIYKYNFKTSLQNHVSVQRTYALNDEAGLVVCDYGRGQRPEVPFPYFAEVWTGLEYSTAALMIYTGMVQQGMEIVESARRRYDGERRNPWDEPECGYYYARPLAGWAPLLALSGFRYDGVEKRVQALPAQKHDPFSCFFSCPPAWGEFTLSGRKVKTEFALTVHHGKLPCRSLIFPATAPPASKSAAQLGGNSLKHQVKRDHGRATVEFSSEITVGEGVQLLVRI
jgi:uncharacterized protein (DUF608 family)